MINVKRSILYRIFFSFSCVLVFAGLVVWYIFNIQFVEGKRWRALSDSLTMKYKVIQAARGNIYSEDRILLATSVPRYELRMDVSILNPDTFDILVDEVRAAITPKTKPIVPVHLFGQCSDMEALLALAKEKNLFVIEDTAQAINASYTFSDGSVAMAGTMGDIGTTSFLILTLGLSNGIELVSDILLTSKSLKEKIL